jgi:hypothetical protein
MYDKKGNFVKDCDCFCHEIFKHCSCDCSEKGLIEEVYVKKNGDNNG